MWLPGFDGVAIYQSGEMSRRFFKLPPRLF